MVTLVKFMVLFGFHWVCASEQFSRIKPYISGIDLVNGNKKEIQLREATKATVVAFLSVRCPCSGSHQPVLDKLAREFEPKGFQFVGIHSNANEDFSLSREFFGKSHLSFPVVQDSLSEVADQYLAFKTPHVFVISPKLEILFQGGVDNSKVVENASQFYLRDALVAINDGHKPVETDVRVLGCEIRRP